MPKRISISISLQIILLVFLIVSSFLAYNLFFLAEINDLRIEGQKLAGAVESDISVGFQNKISSIQRISFVFFMLAILFVVGLTLNIIPIFLFSLRAILRGITMFRNGKYDYRIPLISKNEFGAIASSLNWAMEEIGNSQKALQSAKQKAEDEREKLKTVLSGAGDGIVVVDAGFRILIWNKAAAEISGWQERDALGRPIREVLKLVREHDRKEAYSFLEEVVVSKKAAQMDSDTILVRKNGQEVPVADSAAPLFDNAGKLIGAIVIFRDVSKEKEARSLHSDFAYASHQLRTPVTRALWAIEAVLETRSQKKIKENVVLAHSAVKSVERLAEELIIVSEIDQGQIVPKIAEIKLNEAIPVILSLVEDKRKRKGIAMSIAPIHGAIIVKSDKKLLERALLYVLDNAIEYNSPKGKVLVALVQQERGVLIEIHDSGMGIAEEQHALIFTKFFRGSNVMPESVGAGLGLYISQKYIKLLGGKIWFESKENEGTTFNIFLPRT